MFYTTNLCLGLGVLLIVSTFGMCKNVGFLLPTNSSNRYTAAELHAMDTRHLHDNVWLLNLDLPKGIRRRKRGKAGGVKKLLRKRRFRPYLSSVIMVNVQSLRNKGDELQANTRYLHDYRNISRCHSLKHG